VNKEGEKAVNWSSDAVGETGLNVHGQDTGGLERMTQEEFQV